MGVSKGVRFHNTHPIAYANELEMNRLISQLEGYVEGARIIGHDWDKQTNDVQYFYSIPDGVSPEDEVMLEAGIRKVILQFSTDSMY